MNKISINKNKRIAAITSITFALICVISGSLLILNPGGTNMSRYARADDTATVTLLHCNGVDGSINFTDSSTYGKTNPVFGDAKIRTDQYRFGGGSAYFDGDSDYVELGTYPDSDFDFGSGDFTIDFWLRVENMPASGNHDLIAARLVTGYSPFTVVLQGGTNQIVFGSSFTGDEWKLNVRTGDSSIDINTWYHIAAVRWGNTFRIYLNGILKEGQSVTEGSVMPPVASTKVGGFYGGNFFQGHMDEIRITKGVARWTSNFIPSSAEYVVVDTAPSTTTPTSITQATDGSGGLSFQTTVSDANFENTRLKVEYSDDDGNNWYLAQISSATPSQGNLNYDGVDYQIGSTNAIDTSMENTTLTIVWDTKSPSNPTSLDDIDQDDIKLRLTPNDFTLEGTPVISSAFEVDNQDPVITPGNVAIKSGTCTGIGGACKNSDNPILQWDGQTDGEIGSISSVIFDGSDFRSSDTNLSSSNTGSNVWEVSLSGTLDTKEDTGNNISVDVVDSFGNTAGPITSTASYDIDTILPTSTIDSNPDLSTASTGATFEFSASESGTFECKIETSGVYFPCSSPIEYTSLDVGSHDFFMRAIDDAGNIEETPQTYAWTIISSGPAPVPPAYSPTPNPPTSTPHPNTIAPSGGSIEKDYAKLILPGNTFVNNTTVDIYKITSAPKAFEEKEFISGANISAEDQITSIAVKNLNRTAKIIFNYSDNDILDIEESSLKIYYFDESINKYIEIPTIVDAANNTATAETNHFSIFALWGDKLDTTDPVVIENDIADTTENGIDEKTNNTSQPIYHIYQNQPANTGLVTGPDDGPIEYIQEVYNTYNTGIDKKWQIVIALLLILLLLILGIATYQIYRLRKQLKENRVESLRKSLREELLYSESSPLKGNVILEKIKKILPRRSLFKSSKVPSSRKGIRNIIKSLKKWN